AVILQHNWAYDDSADYVPSSIRNRIPHHLKTDGKLYLRRGTEGFMYRTSLNHKWGVVIFIIKSMVIHVAVPLNYLTIGVDFLPLSQKIATSQPLQSTAFPPPINYANHGNSMDAFIHAIWFTLRSRIPDLQALTPGFDFVGLFFGPDFLHNIQTILRGFVPDARRVFKDGNFSLDDILNIPKLTSTWAPTGSIIYIRLYHKEDRASYGSAIYVGQTIQLQKRHSQHNTETLTSRARHYQIARQFTLEERHMIPICIWEDDIPFHVLTMAEQTVVLLLNSYMTFTNDTLSPTNSFYPFFQRIQFMRRLVQDLQQRLPWAPNITLTGLNVETPLISTRTFRYISAIPGLQFVESAQTFTRYRTPIAFSRKDNCACVYRLSMRDGVNKIRVSISIPEADVNSMQIPNNGFLIFEIMDNGQPHPNPWIRCPAVGPFEDFIQASALGIRFEWYNENQNTWLSTTVHKFGSPGMVQIAAKENNIRLPMSIWLSAIYIIQALEGIVYSDYQPNQGFYKRLTFGSVHVKQLQTDHLKQTYQWIHRPEILRPFPKIATWQYNFSLMVKRFSSLSTFIPHEP
ncbi:hypothetical protein CI102_15176, partial [Trichoderma harzianum]